MAERTVDESSDAISLATWLLVLTCVYSCALYGSAVTVAGALLPQMRGHYSASLDQISWVVTASIVAGAIGTPPTPWLAARFGRKNLMIACVSAVTATSFLIGTAGTLTEMVFWRVMQALMSAPVIALTQTFVLDAFPVRRRGFGLAIWTVGIASGWVMGPTFGTILAEWGDWRIAFLAFGPLGAVAILLCTTCLPSSDKDTSLRFDWFGFLSLSIALAALQFVLNRGQRLDWYESPEIIVATVGGLAAVYFFTYHTITTRRPFINWNVMRDRNFVAGLLILMAYAFISLAPLILIPTMLQDLRGLELLTIGLILVPRGVAQIITTLLISPLIDRLSSRLLIVVGLTGFAAGSAMMANYNLDIGVANLMLPTIIQGAAMAVISVTTMSVSYATLPPPLRTDGATLTGLGYTIASSMGVAVSVVVLTRSAQMMRADLAEHVVATNELLRFPEYADIWNLNARENLLAIHSEIGQQAVMIGYMNVYWMLAVLCLALLPIVLLISEKRR